MGASGTCHTSAVLQVEKLDGNTAHIRAADGGLVKVELTNGPNFDGGRIFEFDGVVKTPENMTEVSRTNFGDNFGAP